MREIIGSSQGINWIQYYRIQLDDTNLTAKIIEFWRAHKFEDRGYHPPNSEITYVDLFRNNCDIKQWMADGKPGGIDGLKSDYRKPDAVSVWNGNSNINSKIYTLIK